MDLDNIKLTRANALHVGIKTLIETRPDLIAKYGIEICKKCGGTGLMKFGRLSDRINYHWESGNYCEECNAIGFINLKDLCRSNSDGTEWICEQCYGMGCDNCRNAGVVDWVDHSMGR